MRLSEDILADLKRKLKGQVSLADNVRRVAKFELKSALARAEILDEEIFDKVDPQFRNRLLKLSTELIKGLKKAQKDLDRIK